MARCEQCNSSVKVLFRDGQKNQCICEKCLTKKYYSCEVTEEEYYCDECGDIIDTLYEVGDVSLCYNCLLSHFRRIIYG